VRGGWCGGENRVKKERGWGGDGRG